MTDGAASLRFLGAAGTVTGSRFLVETPGARVLVDCGLFQGEKSLRLRNREPFPVPPESVDAVLVTHAHIDHTGYLPALVRQGFRGGVYATEATTMLSRIVLPDAGRLQEDEARYANRKGFSKHSLALPLYTEDDAFAALERFRTVPFDEPVEIAGLRARFRRAGHILGAASVYLSHGERTLLVSGDLGRPGHPILAPPEPVAGADVVLVESTYGDRVHDEGASLESFRDAIARTAARGGVVVIPAFAVDRTEVLLYHLRRMTKSGEIPLLPVYVDSPMALAALAVYRRAIERRTSEIRDDLERAPDLFDPGRLVEARDTEASKAINRVDGPCVIVSASGMATGGRVLHHLARRLPDPRNAVILAGFQAAGTRGRSLQEGKSAVKMLGRYVPVRAEVVNVPAFSVHADAEEIVGWLRTAPSAPDAAFVVHGEEAAADALRERIERELGWTAVVPASGERVRLD